MATELAVDDIDLDEAVIDLPYEVLTLEDFLRLPEIKPALEFIGGRIEQKMSPSAQHGRIGAKLPARINEISEDARLGSAFVEVRSSFGGESYVPDISYFVWDRLPIDKERRVIERVSFHP